MTTPELITDEIVDKVRSYINEHKPFQEQDSTQQDAFIYHLLLAIQDDITRPYRNLINGWKQNSEAYERALNDIRNCKSKIATPYEIADVALKGDYHETDFTEFCEQNPITEKEEPC